MADSALAETKGFVLWFTGLPCSGKTSLSNAMEKELGAIGHRVEILDGDVVRQGLSKDLGFSKEDRIANIERAAFIAMLLARNGVAALASFVSPYRRMRDNARKRIQRFIEVYVRCPLEVCEKRDVKGMYRLAREGKIASFTGVSDPYEEPLSPEIVVDTDKMSVAECAGKILDYLDEKAFLLPRNPFPFDEFLTRAFQLARNHHQGQTRKDGLPYLTHPIAVAKLLKEAGYSREAAAAGLLHDVLEDTGCEREEMEKAAGSFVTRIVLEVTEKDQTVPWRQRKADYLENLKKASAEALAVSCADKIHNAASLLEGCKKNGDGFFRLFAGGMKEKVQNYEDIYQVIVSRQPSCPLLPVYRRHLDELSQFITQKIQPVIG